MTILPGTGQSYPLKISLQLIAEIEGGYGSLYQLAENLLDESLPFSTVAGILKTLYRHAGCKMTEEALDDFILRQPGAELLTAVLLEILEPIDRMGAVMPGGDPDSPKRRISLKYIRMFFMGVPGWPPLTVMQDADIEDLADAYEGYACFHGLAAAQPSHPPAQFLHEMMKRFPDIGDSEHE